MLLVFKLRGCTSNNSEEFVLGFVVLTRGCEEILEVGDGDKDFPARFFEIGILCSC